MLTKREILCPDSQKIQYIENIRGDGYCFAKL